MGRAPTGKVPIQSIKIVRGKHLEIMRRLIAGESQRRIALELGMSEGRLSVICNSPLFKRKYAELEAEVKQRFVEKTASVTEKVNELQPEAVGILEKILKNKEVDGLRVSLPLKRDVALDLLELGGNGKKQKTTGGDAMSDVIRVISEGFDLARTAMEERSRREEVVDPGAVIIDDLEYDDVTPETLSVESTDNVDNNPNTELSELDKQFAKAI